MPKFFIKSDKRFDTGETITIVSDDAFHISHTLRMKKGDRLTVTSQSGTDYETVIDSFSKDTVNLQVLSACENNNEPSVFSSLFQALTKGDKMDFVIQKAIELGVGEIYPVISSRCIVKTDEKWIEKKSERWNKIAREAAKQCGRGIVPQVHSPIPYKEALDKIKSSDIGFICYESAVENNPKSLFQSKKFNSAAFFVGPEGGISPEEISEAKKRDIPILTLGKLILRTETASSAVLSMLLYETEF